MKVSSSEDDFLQVDIIDDGPGIPGDALPNLFTNYYQVRNNYSNSGTGVGLALSKNIVELHQGTIKVESLVSTPERKGRTVFSVLLPFNTQPASQVSLIHEPAQIETVKAFKFQEEIDTSIPPASAGEPEKYSIVIAEDNHELRAFIVKSLPGYQVSSFADGESALAYSRENLPDLLITDVIMPGMNGFALCQQIKSDERTSHIPVIILTALASQIHQINGFETGADLYLTKPFSVKLLSLNVSNILTTRERLRIKYQHGQSIENSKLIVSRLDQQFLDKATRIVEAHMENPEFGVGELAIEIGMSKSVFFRKISAITDLSLVEFIKMIKLRSAHGLLQQNRLTISEIAALVGFNDRKYFSREFKKVYGKSPSEMAGLASSNNKKDSI